MSSSFLARRGFSVGNRQFARRADLVGPVQRVEQQTFLMQRETAEMLAIAERDLADGDRAGLLERLAEQGVRLDADSLRFQVVRALEIHAGLDLRVRAELDDVDGVRRGQRQVVEVGVRDDHVLVLAHLVAAFAPRSSRSPDPPPGTSACCARACDRSDRATGTKRSSTRSPGTAVRESPPCRS